MTVYLLSSVSYRPSHKGLRPLIVFASEAKAKKYMKKYPNANYQLDPVVYFK